MHRFVVSLLMTLTGCYVDRVHTEYVVKWHREPVACLSEGTPPPTKPEDVFCYVDWVKEYASAAECDADQSAKWAEYGRQAFMYIHLTVEPACYEAAGRAK